MYPVQLRAPLGRSLLRELDQGGRWLRVVWWDYSSAHRVVEDCETTAMAKSVHADAQRPVTRNARIVLALIVSMLLHTPLFLSPGGWHLGSVTKTTAPALLVRIEPQGEKQAPHDIAHENASREIEELAAPVTEPSDVPPRDLQVADLADAGTQQEARDAPASSETALGLDSMLAETGADAAKDALDELTSPAPESAAEPVPMIEAVVATVAPAQQVVLTRRLVREARALLHSSALQRDLTFEHDDRAFTAVLTRHPASDAMGIERVAVEITTEHGGERVHTSMHMKRLTFSHFTQLIDRWDPWVQLHDDEIAGRFHSNSEILLTYDRKVAPRLLGKVTTARGIRITGEKGWRSRREIFAGGLESRAARVRLPEISLPVAHPHATRNADVHVVRGDSVIVFNADGGYDCTELASRSETRRGLAPAKPTYIVATRDTELHVRGVVNGNVTLYSPARILVQGDLTHAHAPDGGGDSDDFLALVSDGNVEIDRADVTGPGDLEIHAAIYARRRFIVRNARARGGSTLFIYGSLTAGSVSETEPRYATRIEFDPRFERVRPPGFPETDQYEIEAWDGRWRVAEASPE
jgi:hypothetical protein